MALIGHKALFREKLDRLWLGVKERLPANQSHAVTDRLILPGEERRKALQKHIQNTKMEEAGVIGAFTLAETTSIPAGDTPQEWVKNGVSKNRLPGRDSLNLPEKMRGGFPLAQLAHALDKVMLVHLVWRRKEIPLRGRQRRIDGWVETRRVSGERLMQEVENAFLKRPPPRAPRDDAQAPEELVVPVQSPGNLAHCRVVHLRQKKKAPPVLLKYCFGLGSHGAIFI
ncbi:MAG: hypothetical protein K2N07_11880 [Desulfovibrio sp.]|nr:hypothetical protein [Desulfovibrio sp.]